MNTDGADFDADRQLCDDGNCLGVIVDGKCNVCGLGATTSAATSPRDNGSGHPGVVAPPSDGGDEMVSEGGHVDEAFDDEERQLCPDGACTGLLGSDGKCKECGRSAAS
ncbi:MAG: hypothetical protein ACXVAN_16945 [Polyangia bacterium]